MSFISIKTLITIWYLKNNAWVTVNNDFWLDHELGDLPINFVTRENCWQIASWTTQKSLFLRQRMNCFISYTLLYVLKKNSAKTNYRSPISPLSLRTVFTDLVFWRHHSQSVASRELGVLALWRHIRRLFLQAQIGAKAIFTSV